jgi:hypothetical protein
MGLFRCRPVRAGHLPLPACFRSEGRRVRHLLSATCPQRYTVPLWITILLIRSAVTIWVIVLIYLSFSLVWFLKNAWINSFSRSHCGFFFKKCCSHIISHPAVSGELFLSNRYPIPFQRSLRGGSVLMAAGCSAGRTGLEKVRVPRRLLPSIPGRTCGPGTAPFRRG